MYVSAHVLEREQVINIELRHVYPVIATITIGGLSGSKRATKQCEKRVTESTYRILCRYKRVQPILTKRVHPWYRA